MPETIPDVSRRIVERGVAAERIELDRVVLVKCRYGPLRRRLFRVFGLEPDLTVRLDELGTTVWRLIDGRSSVAEILHSLESRFPQQADLAPRLSKFLGAMVSRELVVLR